MTVEIGRDALLGAIRQVVDVVEARNTIPILSNLLIVVEGGELTVSGTDLNLQATSRTVAAGSLSTTVDAQKLLAAVQSFKAGRLVLAPVEGRSAITVKQGRGVRTLLTLPIADFPARKIVTPQASFTIGAAVLARLFDATIIAVSSDETRPYLKGVFMHTTDTELRAAATDGHRAVRVSTSVPEGATGMPDIIVPTKVVALLRKLLAKPEGEVSIETTDRAIQIELGTVKISAALIDGTFPDYTRVIPSPGAFAMTLHRDALIEPVKAAISILSDKVRAVAIDCEGAEQAVTAADQMGTNASEPLEAEIVGKGIRFGVNATYLTQVAAVFAESGKLTLSLHDANAPILMVGDKDPDITAVIMPMRV
jgi:DNA polymerase-3 subunit beta